MAATSSWSWSTTSTVTGSLGLIWPDVPSLDLCTQWSLDERLGARTGAPGPGTRAGGRKAARSQNTRLLAGRLRRLGHALDLSGARQLGRTAVLPDELLGVVARDRVRHLHRGRLHEVGGRRLERA